MLWFHYCVERTVEGLKIAVASLRSASTFFAEARMAERVNIEMVSLALGLDSSFLPRGANGTVLY